MLINGATPSSYRNTVTGNSSPGNYFPAGGFFTPHQLKKTADSHLQNAPTRCIVGYLAVPNPPKSQV